MDVIIIKQQRLCIVQAADGRYNYAPECLKQDLLTAETGVYVTPRDCLEACGDKCAIAFNAERG